MMPNIFEVHTLEPQTRRSLVDAHIWTGECPIPLERLREVHITHHTFDRLMAQGVITVLDVIAPYVCRIFQELFKKNFPIQKVMSIAHYKGDDDLSMAENNSSAFNFRKVARSERISIHSYGTAVDINPVQNPFLRNDLADKHPKKFCSLIEVWPEKGVEFLNRSTNRPGMVEPIVDLFYENGLRGWGGRWNGPIDYHHFEVFRNISEFLALAPYSLGEKFFSRYVNQKKTLEDLNFIKIYEDSCCKEDVLTYL